MEAAEKKYFTYSPSCDFKNVKTEYIMKNRCPYS